MQSAYNLALECQEQGIPADFISYQDKYKIKGNEFIWNWGCSKYPEWYTKLPELHINTPEAVLICANKIKTFYTLYKAGINLPKWTQKLEKAKKFENLVIVRHKVKACEGEGIEIFSTDQDIPQATLYTEYVPNNIEFRVYMFMNKPIGIYQKKKRNGWKTNKHFLEEIKTYTNGWCFVKHFEKNPDIINKVIEVSTQAVKEIGIDYAGVDVIYSKDQDKAMIIEVNSGPMTPYDVLTSLVENLKCL